MCIYIYRIIFKQNLIGRVCQFFYISKYDIIRTENGYVIDSFIPEILTFKECSKLVQHVTYIFYQFFHHGPIIMIFSWSSIIDSYISELLTFEECSKRVQHVHIYIYIYIFIIHIVFLLRGYQFFYHSPIIMIFILSSLLFPEISFVHLFTLISNITIPINVSVDTFIGISIQ